MKHFVTRIAAVLALAAVAVSFAAGTSAKLSWIAPTTYSDNTPLPVADISSYTITWGPTGVVSGPAGSTTVPAGTLATSVSVPCGSTAFTIAVTTTATAKYPNTTSGPTSPVPYASGVSCAPNPPSGLVVQ